MIARHTAFVHNILKYAIKIFYKIGILIFYKSICKAFIVNANMVKAEMRKII